MIFDNTSALEKLCPDAKLSFSDNVIEWRDTEKEQPSEEEIQATLQELRNAEPMRLLRQERNIKLSETDWMSFSDSPTMTDAWRTYRQALRDLPQNFSPIIDIITEDGYPIVKEQTDWPEKPE